MISNLGVIINLNKISESALYNSLIGKYALEFNSLSRIKIYCHPNPHGWALSFCSHIEMWQSNNNSWIFLTSGNTTIAISLTAAVEVA